MTAGLGDRVTCDELLTVALAVATEAGAFLLDGLDRPRVAVETKSSASDLVSEMDRGAEELIVARLRALRPDDAVLAEEGTATTGTSGVRWIVDPLDGTTNYLYGIPLWSVSIAAELDGELVAGVVECPVLGETFSAATGQGAWLTRSDSAPRRLQVRAVDGVDEVSTTSPHFPRALVATGFWYDRAFRSIQGSVVANLMGEVRDMRRGGSAAIDLAWVAAGRTDAYYEIGPHPWDVSAGMVCVREAGGVATYSSLLDGEPPLILAARPSIHAGLHEWLSVRS